MSRQWAVRAGAAVFLAAAAVAAAWLGTRGGAPSAVPQRFAVHAELDPRTLLFGDRVTARVDVELDRRAVDPASVRVHPSFGPNSVTGASRVEGRAGNAVVLHYRFGLVCLTSACLPQLAAATPFPPARVTYRIRSGAIRSTSVEWPRTQVGTRLQLRELNALRAGQPLSFRGGIVPRAVSYRVRPALVAGSLYAAAVLVALLAGVLLAPELGRLLRLTGIREDPLAGLPPLERALALLERALASGDLAEQRKALDRLARELRRRGDDGLAGAARRLAWSRTAPGEEARDFTGTVARAIASQA